MRVIVVGREGQLARALADQAAASGVDLVCLGRPELDLADAGTIERALSMHRGDVIVNAAAYTDVNRAESDFASAMQVNADGVGALAQAAARHGVPLVHISTDYVFGGDLGRPYREDDEPAPVNAYGLSKLEGERRVTAAGGPHLILRTAGVYSRHGSNFVKTMLRLGATQQSVRVVRDQIGSPTSAACLAAAILAICPRLARGEASSGLYHLAGEGQATWAEFATHIFACAQRAGLPPVDVEAITTADYPTPARRPADSRLDTAKFRRDFGFVLPDWRDALATCVSEILDDA